MGYDDVDTYEEDLLEKKRAVVAARIHELDRLQTWWHRASTETVGQYISRRRTEIVEGRD